ncbi:MAG TPA: hypothetical protein G4O19_04045 [Dehalococcoidia bacterium]|nr:hypothetical protein [Dehalococcoidia bacterium]
MRMPGIPEIILIIIVASIVLLAIRLIGTPARRRSQKLARERLAEKEGDEGIINRARRSRLQLVGVIAIILGIIILISSLSLVKWVFWGPIWALVIVAIGTVVIFIARRR